MAFDTRYKGGEDPGAFDRYWRRDCLRCAVVRHWQYLVSSTSMKAASATTTAISQGLNLGTQRCCGGGGAGGGSCVSVTFGHRHAVSRYRRKTFGSTDIPGRRWRSAFCPGSRSMRTGMRCTTFT